MTTIKYEIHNNRDRPYLVELYPDNLIKVHKQINDKYEHIFSLNTYLRFLPGYDTSENKINGNTIIIHLKDDVYMFIGAHIYLFQTVNAEKIKIYVSDIGNNDVPYPYAVGEKYTYLMAEYHYIENKMIKNRSPYEVCYDWKYTSAKNIVHRNLIKN